MSHIERITSEEPSYLYRVLLYYGVVRRCVVLCLMVPDIDEWFHLYTPSSVLCKRNVLIRDLNQEVTK